MTVSLRKRLIGSLMLFTLFAWVMSAVLTGFLASRVLLAQVDRQLEQYTGLVTYISRVFARQLDSGDPLTDPFVTHDMSVPHDHPLIIRADLIPDDDAPALNIFIDDELWAVLEASPRFDPPEQEGFSFREIEADNSHWRLLARYDAATDLWIMVGIELDAARRALFVTLGRVLFPLLIILPLTVLLLYFGVTRGLQPLSNLTRQISRRNPGALEPVEPGEVPEEIVPVVDSLNDLLQRLDYALESEQRFTANAAHELMTPLAAIKTEVQLCQRRLRGTDSADMLERIAARVDRASHTVEQLLTLARVDPDTPLPQETVALGRLLSDAVADSAHVALERSVEVLLDDPEALEIQGSQESLAILLRNLLINAFRYAAPGSTVTVALERREGVAILEICNDCEPLSEAEFRRLEERFYRLPGSDGLGAGLGLSIVRRIADQHGARFVASPREDGRGFCAKLRFTN